HGANIDSELRALLRATYNFRTPGLAFSKISRGGPHASAGFLSAIDARHAFRASTIAPGQRPLTDLDLRRHGVEPGILSSEYYSHAGRDKEVLVREITSCPF